MEIRKPIITVFIILSMGLAKASIDFHVVISENELHPRDETNITILIENEGTASGFYLNESTATALQLVTTAKDLRVEIEDNWIPIEVKSANPVLIGDLPSGIVANAVFRVNIDENAKLGEYSVPVKLKYTKVSYSEAGAGVIITYTEDEVNVEYVKINITKRDYDFSVKSVDSDLRTSRKGIVKVVIQNTGINKICNAILTLNTTPPLMTDLEDMSAYLGDLDPGKISEAEFKVYVAEEALNQTYPATLTLKFETTGKIPKVLTQQIGLKVVKEDVFEVLSVESFITAPKTIAKQQSAMQEIQSLPPFMQTQRQSSISSIQPITIPSRGFVEITVKAKQDMKNVIAMLSFDNPLIQAENAPFLGHFEKGEAKQALFYVKVTAPPGTYRACLMLKYENTLLVMKL